MFKKLLSNLPFNPSLISQVSFYAKRLHTEEKLRRIGLVMVVLSIFIQMFAVISPPEPTLARAGNDIIPGGFTTHAQANDHCERDNYQFRTILLRFGINCGNLARAGTRDLRSTEYDRKLLSIGHLPYGKAGERPVVINRQTYYQRYLWAWDTGPYSTYKALVGNKDDGTPFMVLYSCGNLTIVETAPPPPPPPPPPPKPCPYDRSIIDTDSRCRPCPYNNTIIASNPNCQPPKCPQKPSIPATDPTCKACPYDSTILKSHPDCERCPYAGLAAYSKNDARCKEPCPYVSTISKEDPRCKPCDNSTNQQDTAACLVLSKTARNDTQNLGSADGSTAQDSDEILYSLSVKNTGKVTVKDFVVEENITDVLDYADVTDYNGGTLGANNIVKWPATDIGAGDTITKKLKVKIKSPIPSTPISPTNPGGFDMMLTNVYGNAINIKVPPTIVKTTEIVTNTELPKTGPGETVAMSVILTMLVSYFFARSRLMAQEMDIVRVEYATAGSY